MKDRPILRYDLQVIADWIAPGSRVLDLGCGTGDLLLYLKQEKKVAGTGIESDEEKAAVCIARGLPVVQGDINVEIDDYPDKSFDYVILSQTLQQVYEPDRLIRALLRIGRKAVVSFPNFGHIGCRLQILFRGHAPKTVQLPYEWYNTPNIRIVTIKDFRNFAREVGFAILREMAINTDSEDRRGRTVHILPNLFATYGIILIAEQRPV
ncbi:MAG: methionine biosynthesis protein MetW [Thermodesulfobacteriota bacterium]